jgi:type II secretory pathway component GspD/PulD (secretin)
VEKTNLMIFITPYIIKNEGEANAITRQKGEGLEEFRQQHGIEKKSVQPTMLTNTPTSEDKAGQSQEQAPAPAQTAPEIRSAPADASGIMTGPTDTMTAPESGSTAPASGTLPNDDALGSAPTGTAAPEEGTQ